MIVSHEDLNKLNDKQFEKLVKTLLISIIGNGVTPFSQGKDGAREATFKGKANYPSKANNWKGHWIFQVKYSNIAFGIDKARNQIKYSINGELKKLEEYGYFEDNKCDNYIYITNVPFSGQADKGLHDYAQKKIKNYKVENFDYWDGEKVIGFLNTNPTVRETFFPNPGIEILEEKFYNEINITFVKPNLYDTLVKELLQKKYINIIGQPHVGKSFLSMYIAQDIFNSQNLNEIVLIPIIDNLQSIPKITNCVIILDDLYGDLNYDSIGRQTKIVSSLAKNNYLIVTSRDYIFQEAVKNKELLDGHSFTINQEGAYSDTQLEEILLNHININFVKSSDNEKAYEFIIRNRLGIVRQLRFPHNIQLFTTIIDNTIITKKLLEDKISNAKQIESIVLTWLSQQSQINKNVLLSLAIGKIQTKDILKKICETQWNYDSSTIETSLIENERLVYSDKLTVRLKHPSFKEAIVNYFLQNNHQKITELILNLILNLPKNEKRSINRSLAYKIIEELEVQDLLLMIDTKNVASNFLEIIWLSLIRKNKKQALEKILSLMDKTKKGNRYFRSFVASKAFMKDKEILVLIEYFMKNRDISNSVDKLIEHFSYRIRLKIRPIIDSLDYNNPKDFNLKIKLLGCVGSKYPDMVTHQLISFCYERLATSRRKVYKAINMLDNGQEDIIEKAYREILNRETNKINLKIIKTKLARIQKTAANNVYKK
ncbi:hypothetical protein [Polaribacter sp. HaHaR_3_91]|jgi:hypothetical protein|uniref:nSTAND3 domain-containing NTPase n=1 Tax=Polaribacter sp. HaHaR_3_91 TaxID=2745561 RepID=UPI001C4E67F6|nr:hypothetical protein [Polaribacter sp. HaHaR_3_91]QXP63267.1 hypothetical protein H0I27_15670 [Polaribacter sp. HaHaR_3_91]